MGSLKAVAVPENARGLRVCSIPSVLIWAEGGEDDEVFSIMRGFLSGQLGRETYEIPNTKALKTETETWEVRRLVRVRVLGRVLIVAEIHIAAAETEPEAWWEETLLTALRRSGKFTVGEIETPA